MAGDKLLTKNHPFFPQFSSLANIASANLPIYDLGTSARFAKEMGLVKDLIPGSGYFAGGYKPNFDLGVDSCDFHCDLQDMHEFTDGSVGSIICLSVLEHVINPERALDEIYRLLKSGGIFIASVPFLHPYHGKTKKNKNPVFDKKDELVLGSAHENYGDYWRFTHEGLALLLSRAGFSRVDVYPIDGWLISRLEFLGIYIRISKVPFLRAFINWLDKPTLGRSTSMHFICAKK